MTRIIGLTGGIATGKSTVSNYLAARHHLRILDADIYARDAVAAGSPILEQIFQRYGDRLQTPEGNLNRQSLGEIVFNDAREKAWLEAQIHPYVRERFLSELTEIGRSPATNHAPVVCAIPLLIEANLIDFVTEVWVVICNLSQQLERLQNRNQLSLQQAQARIQSQISLAEKIKFADIVLDNSLDIATLQEQIDRALKRSC